MGDKCDKFYNDLQDTLKDICAKDMIIIMGDLNARVGQDQQKQRQQHVIRSGVGPFTVDIENENGSKLIDFCEMNNIIISNTFFKHKLMHQTSWMHPRTKKWHMIDYTLVNKKFRSSVEDVRMLRGAAAYVEWQNNRGSNLESKFHKNYKRLRKTVKIMTEHRQEEYWDEVCENIEKSIKNNDPMTAFSIIRRLRGGSKRDENMPVQDKSGKLLVNSKDTLKRWREFFYETLNVDSSIDQNLIDLIETSTLSITEERRQNAPLSIEEVKKALSQMKSRRAPGSDEVTVDILKAGGEPIIRWLFEFFTDVWENEQMQKCGAKGTALSEQINGFTPTKIELRM
ncbi:unnamed protein product, partial [Rotaria sp. Silwood2]